MHLASRLIWRFVPDKPVDKIRWKHFFRQITKYSFKFLPFNEVFFHHHHFIGGFGKTVFSVKSSWEVHWIIMFQKDTVCHMGREIGMTVYHLVFFRFKSSVLTCFGSPQPSSFFRVQGRGAHAPPFPDFGRSVNPISTRGSRLCPPHFCLPHPGFSDLAPYILDTF